MQVAELHTKSIFHVSLIVTLFIILVFMLLQAEYYQKLKGGCTYIIFFLRLISVYYFRDSFRCSHIILKGQTSNYKGNL